MNTETSISLFLFTAIKYRQKISSTKKKKKKKNVKERDFFKTRLNYNFLCYLLISLLNKIVIDNSKTISDYFVVRE